MKILKLLIISAALCFAIIPISSVNGQGSSTTRTNAAGDEGQDSESVKGLPNVAPSDNAREGLAKLNASTETESSAAAASKESNLVELLLRMMLGGSEWVLYLLIILSVISGAIILERAFYFKNLKVQFDDFLREFNALLSKNDVEGARIFCQKFDTIEASIAIEGLLPENKNSVAAEKSMSAYIARSRSKMDRGLMFLGTLGNNAPFIGLFGTVLGIIQSFNALSLAPAGGASVVMGGISEALVATAVGLFVAIPAVIAFNWFQSVINKHLNNADAVQDLIIKHFTKT